jgi:hypothetical protein
MTMTKRKKASAIAHREGGKNNTRIEDIMQVKSTDEQIEGEAKFLDNTHRVFGAEMERAFAIAEKLHDLFEKSKFDDTEIGLKAFLADYRAKQAAKSPAKAKARGRKV